MEFINENTIRKIDNLGRIGIPKGIRNRLKLAANQEMEVFTLKRGGKDYVAFCAAEEHIDEEDKYAMVAYLLSELGIDIPEEILEHV